mgnify:CR=1 FL=1
MLIRNGKPLRSQPNETGHYWDLQVFTPTNGGRTYLTFDGLGYIPEEYDIFLINKTTKQAKNLEWESSYRFANTGSESYLKQDLRLVIGTKDYVKENNAGVELYPDAFTLSQNYPNPFNPESTSCPTCKREYDNAEQQQEEARANFNAEKVRKIEENKTNGSAKAAEKLNLENKSLIMLIIKLVRVKFLKKKEII